MKVTRTFTFIISRNFGHPLTWNVEAWRVYVGGMAVVTVLAGMAALSLHALLLQPRLAELERRVAELEQERDALLDQVHNRDQGAFDAKVDTWGLVRNEARDGDSVRAGDRGAEDEDLYVQPVRVGRFSARVLSHAIEAVFRLEAQGPDGRLRGGFLFAVFENRETDPVTYVASPRVEVNDIGFPQLYKTGIRFSRIRTAQTYRRRIARESDETFTHVTVYLFSLRGGLMAKERYPLERDLFVAGT